MSKKNTEKEIEPIINKEQEELKENEVITNVELEGTIENTENHIEPDVTEKEIEPDVVNVEPASPEINSDEEETKENEVDSNKEELVTLKVEVNFTDKYDNSIKYVKGKKYSFKAERANELLNDKRGLVSKVK